MTHKERRLQISIRMMLQEINKGTSNEFAVKYWAAKAGHWGRIVLEGRDGK